MTRPTPESTRKRAPFRRLPSEVRREEIIDAAISLYGRHVGSEVGIAEIAIAAGSSRSSIYRYFDSQHDLYVAAVQKLGAELIESMDRVTSGSPSQQQRDRLVRFFDFLEEHELTYSELLRFGSSKLSEETLLVAEAVRESIYAATYNCLGVAAPTPALETAVHSWVAGVEWTGIEWLQSRRLSRTDLENLLSIQLGVMLVGVSAVDPVIAERLTWLTAVEPPDGPFAGLIYLLSTTITMKTVANVADLLARSKEALV